MKSLKVDGHHTDEETWLRERLARDGDPIEIYDFLKLLKKTGKVNFYGCTSKQRHPCYGQPECHYRVVGNAAEQLRCIHLGVCNC